MNGLRHAFNNWANWSHEKLISDELGNNKKKFVVEFLNKFIQGSSGSKLRFALDKF